MSCKPATEAVWSHLSHDLRRFIRRRVADEHSAEDLLQETFLRIHRGVSGLADDHRLAAWVYQIARNVVHDHYRQTKSERLLGDEELVDEREPTGQCRAQAGKWLEELVRQLPEPYREAVQLAELEGLTQLEIAERLGLSHSGAKSRVQRGRVMLRQVLDQCCSFHFDQRGNVIDCDPRPDRTVCRDCDDLELRSPNG